MSGLSVWDEIGAIGIENGFENDDFPRTTTFWA